MRKQLENKADAGHGCWMIWAKQGPETIKLTLRQLFLSLETRNLSLRRVLCLSRDERLVSEAKTGLETTVLVSGRFWVLLGDAVRGDSRNAARKCCCAVDGLELLQRTRGPTRVARNGCWSAGAP